MVDGQVRSGGGVAASPRGTGISLETEASIIRRSQGYSYKIALWHYA